MNEEKELGLAAEGTDTPATIEEVDAERGAVAAVAGDELPRPAGAVQPTARTINRTQPADSAPAINGADTTHTAADSRTVDVAQAAALLRDADDIFLLTHEYPDGDTLGSAFALCRALRAMGKRAQVKLCADTLPGKYAYMQKGLAEQEFDPRFICAVDVADPRLLGGNLVPYADKVDLCIDHHESRVAYARHTLADASCAAAAMLAAAVIDALGVPWDAAIAACIYTAVATDTGCFKYTNTDARAHLLAARAMGYAIRTGAINRAMFDVKSRARIELERLALTGMRFYMEGRVAVMPVTLKMVAKSGARENDMEGLAPLPRQIEGVDAGVMLRELSANVYKVSVRTGERANAAAICQTLGGGGHQRAAGCTLTGSCTQVVRKILAAVKDEMNPEE
ncbi:MAG: DHH family phosphoesterase [Oscillospiraceae bacterium]|nr:DHH family phosphoesterase [Oscillospiraceae bacterium]